MGGRGQQPGESRLEKCDPRNSSAEIASHRNEVLASELGEFRLFLAQAQ